MKPHYYNDLMFKVHRLGYDTWRDCVRSLYRAGDSAAELGEKLGVTGPTILKWLHSMGEPVRDQGGVNYCIKRLDHFTLTCGICGESYNPTSMTPLVMYLRQHTCQKGLKP